MEIEIVNKANGKSPFNQWFETVSDRVHRTHVTNIIRKVSMGQIKSPLRYLKDGVTEIKIDIGPGYRVYFTIIDNTKMLLLGGGDKKSQEKDIEAAKALWKVHAATLKSTAKNKKA